MRRFQFALLAAVATIGLGSIASAADMPTKAPIYKAPVVAPFNWSGFYVGGNVGGAAISSGQITELTPGPGQSGWDGAGNFMPLGSQSSFLGGLQLGYNYQINQFVLGIEADVDWLRYNVSAPEQTPAGVVLTGGDTIGSKKMDWLSTIRGRIGYAGYDRALLYVTGGVAISNLKYQVVDACNTGACGGGLTSGSANETVGYALGGGVEYAFTGNWSAKAEYLYIDFAGTNFTTSASTSVAITPWSADATRINLVRFGLNYRFGGM